MVNVIHKLKYIKPSMKRNIHLKNSTENKEKFLNHHRNPKMLQYLFPPNSPGPYYLEC